MKVSKNLLFLVLAAAVLVALPARAFQASTDQKAAAKEAKWQGYVVRVDKDNSMITIRGGPPPSQDTRQVVYDASTVWTKVGQPVQQDELKTDSFVIFLGTVDNKGILHATRIDLRQPKPSR